MTNNNQINIVADTENSDSHHANRNEGQESYWDIADGTVFEQDLNDAYLKIVSWRRHLFMLTSGATGKTHIKEPTPLLKLWILDSCAEEKSI